MVTDERRRAGGERAAAPIPYIHPGPRVGFFCAWCSVFTAFCNYALSYFCVSVFLCFCVYGIADSRTYDDRHPLRVGRGTSRVLDTAPLADCMPGSSRVLYAGDLSSFGCHAGVL
jgi:hypothetical protein